MFLFCVQKNLSEHIKNKVLNGRMPVKMFSQNLVKFKIKVIIHISGCFYFDKLLLIALKETCIAFQ